MNTTTAPADPASTTHTSSASGAQTPPRRLFASDDFDYAARTALGHAAQGSIDLGLVLATLSRIADSDAVGWFRAWYAAAEDLRAQALSSRATGSATSARAFFLAASEAYDQALSFVDGMPDESVLLPTFRLHRECWDAFVDTSEGCYLPVPVPYEADALPGYLFRPDASGRPRPTVVVTNGSDGSLAGLWAYVIKGSLQRGWNVFVFDGPGQQSLLFERGIPFRHDWEAVLTPVVDLLVGRPDVDADALLAYGISQGGYWLPRALAFEHRFVAAVADGGVMDVARAWNANLPAPLPALLKAGDAARFNAAMSVPKDPATARTLAFRAKPYGAASPFDLLTKVNRYTLHEVVGKITTPLLITDPAGEAFFPGQSAELYAALTGPKVLARFSADQGADGHCEPLARWLVDLRMGDFFADQLAKAAAA